MIADTALVPALVCAFIPIVAAIGAGSAVGQGGQGRSRWAGADMLVGFGLLTGVLIVFAVTTRVPLSWLMAALFIASVIASLFLRQLPGGRSTWIAIALVSPILLKAAAQQPSYWDDFWNWLPSAAYEYHQNSLPWRNLPPSLSIFPGYPQGMPLAIAAASFLRGRFLESAGPIINVLLLAGSSALFAEALAAALVRRGRLKPMEMPPVLIAGAVLITILLNPGLAGSVVLSSYADCGTMVAVGAAGLLGVEILSRLSAPDPTDVEALAWRFGLVGAMLVNLKQDNPLILALVTAGLILIALRDPALRTARALRQLPRMLGPGIVLFALWQWYVTQNLSNAQAFRPLPKWDFAALRVIFTSIGGYIAEAPLFHSLMWLVTAAGIVCFFQSSRKASEARWLAMICATVWLGYNVFLVFVYVGAMGISDSYGAADYWRYTPHVALVGLYAPVMALAVARWPAWMNLRSAVPTLATVALALCVLPLRADLNNPPHAEWQRFVRHAVADMRPLIPPGSNVVIVSFSFDKSRPFGVAARYDLWQLDKPQQPIAISIRWDDNDLAAVTRAAARGGANYLIIQDADGNMDDATDALGLPRIHHELVLFAWRNGAWQKLRSWPIPPALIHTDTDS